MRNSVAWDFAPMFQARGRRSAAPPIGLDAARDLADAPDWEVLRERALRLFRQSIEAADGEGVPAEDDA